MSDLLCFGDRLRIEGINFKGFGIIPKYVMIDTDLTLDAKTIYAYFCSFAGNGNTAFPGRDKILADLPMGKDRFYKHFHTLVEQGYISVVQQKQLDHRFNRNIYTLISNPKKFDSHYCEGAQSSVYSRIRFSGLKSAGYGLIPKAVMIDERLPVKAKGIYAYFCSFTGSGDNAFPKREQILYHLQLNKDTYYKFYNLLVSLNYITVVQRHFNGLLQANDYFLNDMPNEAVVSRKGPSIIVIPTEIAQCPKNKDTENLCPKNQDTENQCPKNQDTENKDTNINNLTINNSNNNSINNILSFQPSIEITGNEGVSEKNIYTKEMIIREIQTGKKLPYEFSRDLDVMTTAIHFITEWDKFYPNGYKNELEQRVYNLFNQALIEMCCSSQMMNLKGAIVSYAKVIDKINELGKFYNWNVDFSDVLEPAMEHYILGASNSEIHNPLQYMKSCIWDVMITGNIGFYEQQARYGY